MTIIHICKTIVIELTRFSISIYIPFWSETVLIKYCSISCWRQKSFNRNAVEWEKFSSLSTDRKHWSIGFCRHNRKLAFVECLPLISDRYSCSWFGSNRFSATSKHLCSIIERNKFRLIFIRIHISISDLIIQESRSLKKIFSTIYTWYAKLLLTSALACNRYNAHFLSETPINISHWKSMHVYQSPKAERWLVCNTFLAYLPLNRHLKDITSSLTA